MAVLRNKDIIRDLREVNPTTIRKWVTNGVIPRIATGGSPRIDFNAYQEWKRTDYPDILAKYLKRMAEQPKKLSTANLATRCKVITGHRISGEEIQDFVYSRLSPSATVLEVTTLLESQEFRGFVERIVEARIQEKERKLIHKSRNPRPCGAFICDKQESRCTRSYKCPYYLECVEYAASKYWQGWTEIATGGSPD